MEVIIFQLEHCVVFQRDLCEVREQLECDKKQVSELETMLKSAEQLQAQAEEDARGEYSVVRLYHGQFSTKWTHPGPMVPLGTVLQ